MKNLWFISTCLLLLFTLENCNKEDEIYKPGQKKQEYTGTTTMVIRYYDFNPYTGQDFFVEEKQYSFNTIVFINPPQKNDGITESNPFNLQISPDRNISQDEEGHIDISSSLIFSVSTGYVLLQYWNYSLNGDQISGILQDNHTAEASAANIIWAWDDVAGIIMTMPFAIANGATMTGTLNANSISLTITGQSVDTYRKFSCQINSFAK